MIKHIAGWTITIAAWFGLGFYIATAVLMA